MFTRTSHVQLLLLTSVKNDTLTYFILSSTFKNDLIFRGRHYILQWRWNWGVKGEGFQEKRDFGGCVITHDRSKLKDAEAVIFHYSALDKTSMPWSYYR